MSDDLTFRDIEAGLWELAQERDNLALIIEETADGPERDELLEGHARTEAAIREYVKAEVTKVDSIAALMRREDAAALVAEHESERVQAIANRHRQTLAYLKGLVLETLQMLEIKRVDGKHGRFRVQKNSVDTVEIRQPELLGPEFQRFELRISGDELEWMRDNASFDLEKLGAFVERVKPIEASKTALLAAHKAGEPCQRCAGTGQACTQCNGSGSVPRAIAGVVIERLSHLRVE